MALVSGQSSNYMLSQDCQVFQPFLPFGGENFDSVTSDGQLSGEGCVFPKTVQTIGNQVDSAVGGALQTLSRVPDLLAIGGT